MHSIWITDGVGHHSEVLPEAQEKESRSTLLVWK